MDGTTLPEDEPIRGAQKRVQESFNGTLLVENVSGDMDYLFRTLEEYLQVDVGSTVVNDELGDQPLHTVGKTLNLTILTN